jgi:hypothetical protein
VTILQGIRDAVGPKTKVLYSRGADLVEGREEPRAAPLIEPQYLRPAEGSAEQGLKGEYFPNKDLSGAAASPGLMRVEFRWDRRRQPTPWWPRPALRQQSSALRRVLGALDRTAPAARFGKVRTRGRRE